MLGIDYYVRVTSYVDRQGSDCYIYVALGIFSSLLVSLCWWENSLQATNRMQVRCFSIVELQLACILPSLYVYDKETFFFFTRSLRIFFSSLIPQDTLSQLDGFRDFVFVISSILRILVIGNYLPSMSVLMQWMERRKKNMLAKLHPLCTGRVMKKSNFPHSHWRTNRFLWCQGCRWIAEDVLQLWWILQLLFSVLVNLGFLFCTINHY